MPPSQVISFIIGTIVILFAAYYVTYYVGMKASGKTRAGLRNRNIVVRDTYSISRDKSFCVVEVAGKVYIVGVGASSMTLLDTIDAQEFTERCEQSGTDTPMLWSDTPVGRYGNKLTQKVTRFIAGKMGKIPEENEETVKKADFANSMQEAEKKAERKAAKSAKNKTSGDSN